MNLLLIDETIPSLGIFIEGINEDTKYVTYSVTDTFEQLMDKIAGLGQDTFSNVGFVFTDERTPLKMFISYNTFISFSGNTINKNNTTDFIKNLVSTYQVKNLDFLACNLLSYDIWKKYFEFLMQDNLGLIVRASNDNTGNLANGGDWILESTNEDISKLYFNDKISNWNELLDSLFVNAQTINDISAVSCGGFHVGVLKTDGSVWMCGLNSDGQLGNGNISNFNSSFSKSKDASDNDISDAIAISCGGRFTGIIKQGGSVWMCGNNQFGQLGNGSTNRSTTFIRSIDVSGNNISNAIAISCGKLPTVGIIKDDGSVWMCGRNNFGQLGNGSTNTTANTRFVRSIDTSNNNISNAIAISCGGQHTGIIRNDNNDNSVWTCGENTYGQLGNGSTSTNSRFTRSIDASGNNISNATFISFGEQHSAIIRNDGSVWTCGRNLEGQLGIGLSDASANKFTKCKDISNNNILGANYISCGSYTTGIIKNDGLFWICGSNSNGHLGIGTFTNSNLFIRSKDTSDNYISNFILASCGYLFTVIIKNDGSIWSCGNNDNGQLGFDHRSTNYVKIYNDDILFLSNGNNYIGIIKKDGSVWTCGNNSYGQLGDGTSTQRTSFVKSKDISDNHISGAIIISCGDTHTGIIKDDGSVWMCGRNNYGQLSDGSYNSIANTKFKRSIDISNNSISDAIAISCGTFHTGIIRNDNSVWICGYNVDGQLGNGTRNTSANTKFTKSKDISDINISDAYTISCGSYHTGIIRNDNSVWTCGYNNYGQLGNGLTDASANKFIKCKDISNNNISNALAISCGNSHTGILKSDGSIWTCGRNNVGQLGIGSTDASSNIKFMKSKDISNIDISNAIVISCGGLHTGIIKQDGTVWMCGFNSLGQLGNGTFNNSNLFVKSTFTGKAKYTNIAYKAVLNNDNNFIQIQDTSNVHTYFPNVIDKKLISSDKSNTSTTFDDFIKTRAKIVVGLEPANTVFTNYVNFNFSISSPKDLIIYYKKETDVSAVQLSTVDDGYGAYYDVSNLNVQVFTKHFSEVGIGYDSSDAPCLTENTTVLTPSGYIKVSELKVGDLVITSDNRIIPIINIYTRIVNGDYYNYPFIIEPSSIAPNYPPETSKISAGHLIKYNNLWIHPQFSRKFKQDKSSDIISYYHVETPNYEIDDLVIDGGLIVETFANDKIEHCILWHKRVSNYLENMN